MIGVVRQDVNKSAGNSGFIGNNWFSEQAANWIQFLIANATEVSKPLF